MNQSKQQANLPPEKRPSGSEGGQTQPDVTNNPPGERQERGQAREDQQRQQPGPGEPSPGLKDRDAPTSDTYGNTRESGESLKR